MDFSSIDIFCCCIDNFGDAGVTYRFANEFKAAHQNCRVRVFIDNPETMRAVAGDIDLSRPVLEHESITYINTLLLDDALIGVLGVADIMVEMFACHIPEPLMELAYDNSKLIINLEYLSAETFVEEYHLKESLLGRGSVRKFFFMPGFRETTGGLIINSKLERSLPGGGVSPNTGCDDKPLIGTIFTYERGFDAMISDLVDLGRDTTLIVFGRKSQRGMSATLKRLGIAASNRHHRGYRYENVCLVYAPFIAQHAYDALLRRTDFNIVRGEDSLARAVLSGKPFIWHAYIQAEKYQLIKVNALLRTLREYFDDAEAFDAWADLMTAFNDAYDESPLQTTSERYDFFFKNLKKYDHPAAAIYYFMHRNCNLISKFSDFLKGYRASAAANNN